MKRRKLLIGLGALSAGGTAAFGTQAFTSAQAERNVDVAVAGDRSSFIAIQPLSSDNASKYVDTESDNTVELELDGDNSGAGQGVAQDAITQLDNLFRVVNQGSQEVSVYFEDDSDAVTFRASGSTDGFSGSGQSLEGPDNSADLEVGEQVVVGMTIDTLNNDVSGQLLDSVVLYADANASAPQQSIPEPQYIVDGEGTDPNTFASISSALNDAESGSVIGIDGGVTNSEIASGTIDVGTADLTLTGYNGRPTLETGDNQLELAANGITLRNVDVTTNGGGGSAGGGPFRTIEAVGDGVTIDGVDVSLAPSEPKATAPVIYAGKDGSNTNGGSDVTIRNCTVSDAPISVKSSGSVSIVGNTVTGSPTEGIFSFGNAPSGADYTVENNAIRNAGAPIDIKLDTPPGSVNGESGSDKDKIESLLIENSISKAGVGQLNDGTRKTGTDASEFDTLQTAIDAANRLTLADSGTFEESVDISTDKLTLKGLNNPVLNGAGVSGSTPYATVHIEAEVNDATVEGFTIRNPDGYYGVYVGSGSGSLSIDGNAVTGNTVEKIATNVSTFSPSPLAGGVAGVYVRGNHTTGITVEDNIIQDVDTTSGSGVNASGISLKSFTDDTTAKGATIQNNLIKNVAGSDRNKGISVNGDYESAKVVGNTINGLTGTDQAAALKAITINQNKSFASTSDPDGDNSDEWIGPANFEVKENEIRQVDGVPNNSFGIIVGNYEELDSTIGGSYTTGTSNYLGVENNNIIDTNVTVGIGRYNLDEGGVNPKQTDTLQVDGNYYGSSDGPSGEDTDGSLSGSGAPVATVGGDTNGSRVDVLSFSSSPNSEAGSSL